MIRRLFEKLKSLRIYAVKGSTSDKHDCMENREVIEKLPLLGGDSFMSPAKYYMRDTYNVKCKICGKDWWQNHP